MSGTLVAQSAEQALREAGALVSRQDEPAALELLMKLLEREPENYEALCSASFLCSRIGFRLEGQERMERFRLAEALAERALALKPKDAEANYVMSVAMGRIAVAASARERIAASQQIRQYVEAALAADPAHAGAWHVLGTWHLRMANLTPAEVAAAEALFGQTPNVASNEEAVAAMEKAVNFRPQYILYRYDLARAYLAVEKKQEALAQLRAALSLPRISTDDEALQSKCQALMDKLAP